MRTAIDDLPFVGVSRVRAAGEITAFSEVATVTFGDMSFTVGVQHVRFRNGGDWAFFLCPCGRRCRTLRLYEGFLACSGCLKRRGLRPRVQLFSHASKRTAFTAPRILARLNSATPARLHPRNGRMLDRRVPLEARLRRSLIVARQYALDEHDKMLGKMLKDK